MKNIKRFFPLFFLSLTCTISAYATDAETATVCDVSVNKTIAEHNAGTNAFAELLTSSISTKLAKSGKFDLVSSRGDDTAAMKKTADSAYVSGQSDSNAITPKAPDILIQTTITDLSDISAKTDDGITRRTVRLGAELRIINAKTGELRYTTAETVSIVSIAKTSAGTEPTKRAACSALAEKLAQEVLAGMFPPKVVDIDSTRGFVTIDIGRDTGASAGQIYTVFAKGKLIKDPTTGKPLGNSEFPLGKIKIVAVQPKLSTGKFINTDGIDIVAAGIEAGQFLRLDAPEK